MSLENGYGRWFFPRALMREHPGPGKAVEIDQDFGYFPQLAEALIDNPNTVLVVLPSAWSFDSPSLGFFVFDDRERVVTPS
ncbi:MAG: hypothetical protein ACK5OB_05350 [Pirellula sp.]|jgi:hypothetical protein